MDQSNQGDLQPEQSFQQGMSAIFGGSDALSTSSIATPATDDTVESAQDVDAEKGLPSEEETGVTNEELPQEVGEQSDEAPAISHFEVLSRIGEILSKLENREITDEEAAQWFKENDEIYADSANRSKKWKNVYRPLLQRLKEAEKRPISPKEAEQVVEKKVIANDQSNEDLEDDKPLTKADLMKILDHKTAEIAASLDARNALKQREKETTKFAISKGLQDEEFERFARSAEALYKVNPDWEDYGDALKATYNALYPSKPKPTGMQTTTSTTTIPVEQIDLSTKAYTLPSFEQLFNKK